ncbi:MULTISPECIES: LacI family DNA-binding transcriptional regulator [Acidobacteriaceae]|uniref:LacI family DNA-binding transcriptional regulator n=1 Tax=Acidobacteriaceae TaxID=204434 RepID=UPI00131B5B70|nr:MULTISPECIES: LacI family DNA-binding transcriptional regulator [Acidobacteriaceae]MDW5266619.1 LacI family DNA-binding transcriptional regulator [Edaphobacter sp.]
MKKVFRPTPKLSDVARLAGVGNATVSRVLNGHIHVSEETSRRVKQAISDLSYSPNRIARSLKGATSGMIGMIVPSISDMFFSQCAEAVEIVARKYGSLLIVMASHDNPLIEFENLQQLLLHRIDGLILSSAQSQNTKLYKELRAITVPVVGLDRPLQEANIPSVISENLEGAKAGTAHLLSHGYDKVLCIHIKPELYPIRERLHGYTQAMNEAGLQPLLHKVESAEDAKTCLKKHLGSAGERIAVFAANNLAARFTWEAIRALHLAIPSQVAMLCFDDFDLADSLTPPMSVVQQTIDDLGRTAAELLFRRMRDDSAEAVSTVVGDPIRFSTQLIIRESCGCHSTTM